MHYMEPSTNSNLDLLLLITAIGKIFWFDRTIYGNKWNITPRKWRWLQELNNREKDIKTETG
jgi:hypothetical protein